MQVRRKYITRIADDVLREHGTDELPIDVVKIAKRLGAQVRLSRASDDLSGFMLRDDGTGQVVIGVNAEHPPPRRRFTIAHELGHLLLHPAERVHVDRGLRVTLKLRNSKSSEGTDIEEREANLFAAELLMPKRLILDHIEKYGSDDAESVLPLLAKRFGVSQQAMTIRLTNLGLVVS